EKIPERSRGIRVVRVYDFSIRDFVIRCSNARPQFLLPRGTGETDAKKVLHAHHPIKRGVGRRNRIRKVASKRDTIMAGALSQSFEGTGVEIANRDQIHALIVI